MAEGQVWAFSVESREEQDVAEVWHQIPAWAPWLELDEVAIP